MTDTLVPYGKEFDITATGLIVHGEPTLRTCGKLLRGLRAVEQGVQFAIGDAILYIEKHFGEKASQVIDNELGWSESTINVYRWTAEHVLFENRRPDLFYSHHQAVAKLPPADQRTWLAQAAGNGDGKWPVSRLKLALKAGGDVPESAWFILVETSATEERDELSKELESRGFKCKPVERRGPKES